METVREEYWGKIEYDTELDEFEAQVCSGTRIISVDRPLSAGCLVTGRCNLRCDFCYGNDESLPKEELSTDEWKQIFARLKSWGLMRVDLSGGEPTTRNDISEIANNALSVGLNVVLSTNGLLLHQTGPTQLPKKTRIHVSLDSGFEDIHEASRLLRSFRPSDQSFKKVGQFIRKCLAQRYRLRVLTCVGPHNCEGLFQLGEYLALLGVTEWNISRILPAGRAQINYKERWEIEDEALLEQISNIRNVFRWMRVRYSNRTEQNGYFLLVLPDGSLATQYTDGRDKVILGRVIDMSLEDLRAHSQFNLSRHARKWIASTVGCQDTYCNKIAA
ncbi:MAG TPA: radical SAM protein [Nitrososphaera sp.]|nr:radical SAM protein [Nitrososphaera sp.]